MVEIELRAHHDDDPGLRNKTILVTGAAGFIGSHLVRELRRRCDRVICLVRPGEDISRIADLGCRIHYGDLLDTSTLTGAVGGVDTIFHLAAVMGGVSPERLFQVNFQGTKNLVEACREQGVVPERFIFASSVTVMGPSGKDRLLNEDAPCRPLSVYGKSKLAAEEFLASRENTLPYTIIRLPVVYGPGSDGGLYIFFKLMSKGLQVNVGTLEATVCFVWDVVQGMIAAAGCPRTRGETYILGEEKSYQLRQIYQTIAAILGRRTITLPLPYFVLHVLSFFVEIHSRLTRSIPVMTREELTMYLKNHYWKYDTRKARRDFGFQSRYPFAEGAGITIDWYRKNGYM
ncbi:MAG: NAD-dependent epimerase/dehydratase family protein [Acidobacteria bacterium]|jgi:nucleoside-diphosphate-sugar epimerase|nr:NAD-dependent epimerase/dehydratase family protein [Acidobacteriota bacterium]